MTFGNIDEALVHLEQRGLGQHEALFRQHLKESIRIELKPAEMIPATRSKFGGLPDLPQEFEWPIGESSGIPLSFIAQINLEQIASFDKRGLLPTAGLLSFFIEPDEPWEQESKVYYHSDLSSLAPITLPKGTTDFAQAIPIFSSEISLPHRLTDTERPSAGMIPKKLFEVLGNDDAVYDELRSQLLGESPWFRMLGCPDLHQPDDPAPPGMHVLLQFDFDRNLGYVIGNAGRLYYVIDEESLKARNFDEAYTHYDST